MELMVKSSSGDEPYEKLKSAYTCDLDAKPNGVSIQSIVVEF